VNSDVQSLFTDFFHSRIISSLHIFAQNKKAIIELIKNFFRDEGKETGLLKSDEPLHKTCLSDAFDVGTRAVI